jgi:hypothetical protein
MHVTSGTTRKQPVDDEVKGPPAASFSCSETVVRFHPYPDAHWRGPCSAATQTVVELGLQVPGRH